MRIARIATRAEASVWAEQTGDIYRRLDDRAQTLDGLLAGAGAAGGGDIVSGDLLAPLVPRNIVAVGLNYFDHVRETGMDIPSTPLLFAKFTSSVTGPSGPIVIDERLTSRVDWEVELAAVVGRTARNVAASEALAYVFGYTVVNDVSARDLQFAEGQWVRGKSLDTFCPLGPVIVTTDEIQDPQALRLQTRVNGEVVQDSSTAEMIFSVAELVAFCSRHFTLQPGDLLLTGTPWGCGDFMDPKRSLSPGDELVSFIEDIGEIRAMVVGADAVPSAVALPSAGA